MYKYKDREIERGDGNHESTLGGQRGEDFRVAALFV